MCGIGLWHGKNIASRISTFQEFMHVILHRGPDNQSIVQLDEHLLIGTNRLAIIDQNERSNQPFAYNHLYLSFNGAIYNFRELRDSLIQLGHTFLTESDTELVIHAYEEYGESCVEMFNGMWAFALVDTKKNVVFCSRDRFGIKPLYYCKENEEFSVGSELKQFKKILKNIDINPRVCQYYLESGGFKNYGQESFLDHVFQLEPGNNLVYDLQSQKLEIKSYYCLEKTSFSSEVNLKELISDSIEKRLLADIDPAVLFSGGLDSSILLYHVLERKNQTTSYSFIEKQDKLLDESPFIKSFIQEYPHKNRSVSLPDDLGKLIKECIYYQDEPPASLSTMAQFSLYGLASENEEKLLLSGQGADELFAGYARNFSFLKLNNLLTQPLNALKFASNNRQLLRKYFGSGQESENQLFSKQSFQFPRLESAQEYMSFLISKNGLRDLLHCEDRNSMRHGIETRVPYLDHRLVEYAYHLPFQEKLKNLTRKGLLIDQYKDHIPHKITSRKTKLAFDTPEKFLLKEGYFSIEEEYKKARNNLPFLNWNPSYSPTQETNVFRHWQVYFLNIFAETFRNY